MVLFGFGKKKQEQPATPLPAQEPSLQAESQEPVAPWSADPPIAYAPPSTPQTTAYEQEEPSQLFPQSAPSSMPSSPSPPVEQQPISSGQQGSSSYDEFAIPDFSDEELVSSLPSEQGGLAEQPQQPLSAQQPQQPSQPRPLPAREPTPEPPHMSSTPPSSPEAQQPTTAPSVAYEQPPVNPLPFSSRQETSPSVFEESLPPPQIVMSKEPQPEMPEQRTYRLPPRHDPSLARAQQQAYQPPSTASPTTYSDAQQEGTQARANAEAQYSETPSPLSDEARAPLARSIPLSAHEDQAVFSTPIPPTSSAPASTPSSSMQEFDFSPIHHVPDEPEESESVEEVFAPLKPSFEQVFEEPEPIENVVVVRKNTGRVNVFVEKESYEDVLLSVVGIEQDVQLAAEHLGRVVDDESVVSARFVEWHDVMNEIQELLITVDTRMFDVGDMNE